MATIGEDLLTLHDWAKRIGPDQKTGRIAELLAQKNAVLDDMLWQEGNLATGHRIIQRTGLPTTYYRKINQGTPTSKSTTAQVDEGTAILTQRTHVDKDLAQLNGDVANFRAKELEAGMQAMSQTTAQTIFYGSAANPEEFVGYSNRYNDLSATNGQNIIDAGGTGSDNSSIWLVGWGSSSTYGIFPKGSSSGLSHENIGLDDVEDDNGNTYRAYKDLLEWKQGIALEDWRYVVRIANIDVSDIITDTGSPSTSPTTDLMELMLRALHRLPEMNSIRPSFYMNRTIRQMLDIQAQNKGNLQLDVGMEEGKLKETLRGVPVRIVDQLTEAEAQVT